MIYPGQKIHASVAHGPSKYVPKAVFGEESNLTWKDFIEQGLSGTLATASKWQNRVEMDIFDLSTAPKLVETLRDAEVFEDASLHRLKCLTFMTGLCECFQKRAPSNI